jgi:hypothetical protein
MVFWVTDVYSVSWVVAAVFVLGFALAPVLVPVVPVLVFVSVFVFGEEPHAVTARTAARKNDAAGANVRVMLIVASGWLTHREAGS